MSRRQKESEREKKKYFLTFEWQQQAQISLPWHRSCHPSRLSRWSAGRTVPLLGAQSLPSPAELLVPPSHSPASEPVIQHLNYFLKTGQETGEGNAQLIIFNFTNRY